MIPKHLTPGSRTERRHLRVSPALVEEALVVATGKETYLGGMASALSEQETPTAFDKGISQFTWLILRFVLVMVPLVFVINGLTKGNWHEAFFFAIAIACREVDPRVTVAGDATPYSQADMILLEKSLLVLEAGVVEGRKVFANILRYVRMGASSNFGNMFSVVGASVFVPFFPMTPIQILANNLLYDISQTAIPTDDVDPEQVEKPGPLDMKQLSRFIVCIGPCSSLFDYTMYFLMLFVFGCWDTSTPEAAARSVSLFQTGWFVESLLTQTLIISISRRTHYRHLRNSSTASRCSSVRSSPKVWPVLSMPV